MFHGDDFGLQLDQHAGEGLLQIVGEIEDEFDIAEDDGDIFGLPDRSFRIKGDTSIERVSEAFGVALSDADFDYEKALLDRWEVRSLGGGCPIPFAKEFVFR